MSVTTVSFQMKGGIDLKASVLAMPPGKLIGGINIEQKLVGGYRRMLGYTKFDTNEVPGEGGLLGVWRYNGKVYAIRNAVGGATAEMHESTGSGWTTKKTGLAPNGSYEFVNYNFAGTEKMYGVSGTHKAFEWDGTTWTDITTGMTTDTPSHLIAHKKHLFLTFGPSLQHSPLGDPTGTWTPVTGASEILLSDDITGLMQLPGGVLGVFSRNSTNILAGSSSADWTVAALSEYGNRMGCISGSLQQLGSRVYFLDDRGVVDFATSQNFGDFADATISLPVQTIISARKDQLLASCTVKDKSQYRLFFSDKTGLAFTLNGENVVGITRFQFPLAVHHICAVEDANGSEAIYFGSTDGYVRQLESGNSFDGTAITAYLRTAFHHYKTPGQAKRFRRARFDIKTDGAASVYCKPEAFFESEGLPARILQETSISGSAVNLGEFTLGTSKLGGSELIEGKADLDIHGDYLSLMLYSSSASDAVWEVDGVFLDYSPRRKRRG